MIYIKQKKEITIYNNIYIEYKGEELKLCYTDDIDYHRLFNDCISKLSNILYKITQDYYNTTTFEKYIRGCDLIPTKYYNKNKSEIINYISGLICKLSNELQNTNKLSFEDMDKVKNKLYNLTTEQKRKIQFKN